MNYADSIVFIDDNFDRQDFPERFSNQIYISTLSKFETFGYVSNFSVKYIARGEEEFTVNGKTRTLKSGQFLIINDGDFVVAEKSKSGCVSFGVSVFLDADILNAIYHNQNSNNVDIEPLDEPGKIEFYKGIINDDRSLQNYFRQILALNPNNKMDELVYLDIAEQLVAFQFRINKKVSSLTAKKKSTQFEICRRVTLAHNFLCDNTSRAFDLNELSQVACLSKYFLIRKFKEIYGLTPQKYHNEIRLRKARELLLDGYTVSDTALLMGFSSIHYFSKTFKNLFQTSPSHYVSNK